MFPLSRPFPSEESVEDEDIYNHLEDLIEYVDADEAPFGAFILSYCAGRLTPDGCGWVCSIITPGVDSKAAVSSRLSRELTAYPVGSITSEICF